MDHKFREDLKNLKIKKILLLKPEGIGDLLCVTPAISLIKNNLPHSQITILCSPSTAPLVQFNPKVDHVFPLDLFWMRQKPTKINFKIFWTIFQAVLRLKKEHFDLVIDFRGDSRNILYLSLLGGKYQLSYINQGLGFLLANKVTEHTKKQHIVDRNLHLLKSFFQIKDTPKLELFINKQSKRKAEKILQENGLSPKAKIIAIHIGYTSPKKAWQTENFVNLIKHLVANYPHIKIAILGTNEDTENAKTIIRSLENPHVIDLTGKLKLLETAWVIKKSFLLIACDSGLTHIAVALNIPTIDLIGPSDPLIWGPYRKEKSIIYKSLPCSPCLFKVYTRKCLFNNYRCINLITVGDVLEKIKSMIDGN